MQVVPENARCQVAHSIEVVVGHHLRLTAGARSKIHQHRVVVFVDEGRTLELRRLLPLLLPDVPFRIFRTFRFFRHFYQHLQRGALWCGGFYLTCHIGVVNADDGLYGGSGVAVDDVLLREHVGGGDDDGTDFAQGQHNDPPLVAAL